MMMPLDWQNVEKIHTQTIYDDKVYFQECDSVAMIIITSSIDIFI